MAVSTIELEALELENGGLTPSNYAVLLGNYLQTDDLLNAKFLWKRTPTAAKKENEEINALWALGKKLWSKDFQGFFAMVKQRQWSEALMPSITALVNKTRQRVFRLICLAYTIIRIKDLAESIDLTPEEAIQFATNPENGPDCVWHHDAASQTLEKSPSIGMNAGNRAMIPEPMEDHQRQFQLLTNYVSFLEN